MASADPGAADEHNVISNLFLLSGVPGDYRTVGLSHYGALGPRITRTKRALKPDELLAGGAGRGGMNRPG